ncbi:MAG: DUF1778 domain-containing protein [Actinobacteria bacterium]|nr:DUF1778 domain-containing protein [Actinomycetota bacterium]
MTERLQKAAAVTGETLSEFIRRAAAARADTVLSGEPSDDWSDVIGAVHGGGGRARRTGDAFAELVAESKRKR